MNEQQSRQLWVIRFCIKVVYPKYNLYVFLVYLAIKYRIWWQRKLSGVSRMDTYLLKTIPQHAANFLLKDTLEDYLPVFVDKCVIISKEQFIQLCSENLYYLDNGVLWLVMKLSSDSKRKFKEINSNKQSSKNNLSSLTSEIYKLLWTDTDTDSLDNIRMVPVVGSKTIPDGEAHVTENEFYNISSTFGLINKTFEITFHPVPALEYEPKMATSAEVSLILNEYELSMDFLREILSNHFEKPRALSVNDVFSIELSPEITGHHLYKYQDLVSAAGKVYFKCKTITFEEKTDSQKDITEENDKKALPTNKTKENDDIIRTFFIAKGVTQMSMTESLHMVKPKDEFFTLKGNSNLLHQCPTGLKEKFDQIQEAVQPFLHGDINDLSSSLSSPIIPMLLLTGSIGSGRHRLIRTIAKYNGLTCLPVDCGTIMSTTAKQTESKIDSTIQKAKGAAPCIVMLNHFEVFAVDPENNEDCRVIEYFMNTITDLYQNYTKHQIIFIAVTERQDLKPNILRLFLDKFHITRLNAQQRYDTLEWFAKAMQLKIDRASSEASKDNRNSASIEVLKKVAAKTETFAYGDLDALMHFALRESYLKQQSNHDQLSKDPDLTLVKEEDFDLALESIRSLQRQHLDAPKIPKVYWKDIGGLDVLKKELMKTIEFPIKYPHLFKNSNLKRSGILLYGPPGCGKTLVAKAVSTELNVSFLSVKGPELLNMYIGQSEENVRKVFASARAASPCIVFLDELDALAPRRGAAGDSGGASDRLVSQLLADLDGVTSREDADTSSFVFVMGATNRPDLLEQSLLRPGRLDKLIYVGPCVGTEEKTSVLIALCRKHKLREEVDLASVAEALPERCTGADLMQVVSTARAAAVRNLVTKLHQGLVKESELSPDSVVLGVSELCQGVESFQPSITEEELAYYESLKSQM